MIKYRNEMLETLKEFISFNSITDYNDAIEGAPFGKTNRACLDYIMEKAKSLGFSTIINNGYYGYAEIGSGDELILILSHLDIVPVGNLDNWDTDPLTLTIKEDGLMYGRGVSDDKGPGVASLYAVKSLMDEGYLFNKRVRLLFGCNEETGFECVSKYVECEELPTYGFTPDSSFPLCHGEKGIMRLKFRTKNNDFININGGMATNAVPETCSASILSEKLNLDKLDKIVSEGRFNVIYKNNGDSIIFTTTGVSAHASTPEDGDNSITTLFKVLKEVMIDSDTVNDYLLLFETYDGKGLDINLSDDYGSLTMNVGTVELVGEDIVFNVDIRYPITMTSDDVINPSKEKVKNTVYEFELMENKAGIYFELDSPLVKACLESYQKVTGDLNSKPFTMGGGTYARSMPNLVAVGGSMPKQNVHAHEANERANLEDFFKQAEIHKEIVKRLLEI